jgi:uroporphyrin-III C-methyltransferase
VTGDEDTQTAADAIDSTTDAIDSTTDATDSTTARDGTVYLVGSGPGDPELLTLKARRLIESADVVLHDRLPGPDILGSIPEPKREDVGKRAGGERTPQAAINERLVALAREGHSVVRLKGGDPFLFGRGGEELDHLASAGVPVEVVPGVTSALAVPAVAGIPATHRDHASSVTFVTGHEDPSKPESIVDWDALAATGGTLVVLMGVGRLPDYTAALREAGMDSETPVALVERGTWPEQQVATGTLETIVAARDEADIEPPAVTVIGDVAGTHDRVVEWLRSPYGHRTRDDRERDDRTGHAVEESPE